jgi:phage N-6-adenine-methyltransferase
MVNTVKNRNLNHSDNWKTPKKFYDEINKEFNFDFDPCPYSEGEPIFDGLKCEWGNSNFVNPPYSRGLKDEFVKKGIEEFKKGKTVVFLIPVSTSTKLFHEVILPNNPEIRFIKGRISFEGYNTKGEWVTNQKGMHDSMLVIFKK